MQISDNTESDELCPRLPNRIQIEYRNAVQLVFSLSEVISPKAREIPGKMNSAFMKFVLRQKPSAN